MAKNLSTVNPGILKSIYRKRHPWAHKYDFGHVLVIGGSRHYTGSPALNALAALRAGADLATIAAPERAADIAASFSPNLIAYPLEGNYLNPIHLPALRDISQGKTAVVIGGGLTKEPQALQTVLKVLMNIELPTVVDADAIHAVAGQKSILKRKKVVLTPHAHEFEILSGYTVENDEKQRAFVVQKAAKELGCVILLKGHIDVISDGIRTAFNRTGSPLMTKGGMGDTLAGICGTFLARKVSPFTAACAAAYVNGKAGEIAAKKLGESVLATDLLDAIPQAIK